MVASGMAKPDNLPRHRAAMAVLRFLLRHALNVRVRGVSHFPKGRKKPLVIIGNHLSLVDAPCMQAFLPEKPLYPINPAMAAWWPVRLARWLSGVTFFPLEQTNPLALRALIRHLQAHPGTHACIFPEGRLSPTGKLMKMYNGSGLVADKLGADLLPVTFRGLELSRFHLKPKAYPTFFRPKVTMTIHAPVPFRLPKGVRGRARRALVGTMLYDVMSNAMFAAAERNQTLLGSLLEAARRHGRGHVVLSDVQRNKMTYGDILLRAFILATLLRKVSKPGENVGLMLPNAPATVVAFFALQAGGRVPAMVNFTSGAANILAGCKVAGIRTIVTSRAFIEKGRYEQLEADISPHLRLVYLEDIRNKVGLRHKLAGKVMAALAFRGFLNERRKPSDPAAILFTSGSEGTPKGVVLSHRNLVTNRWQCAARMDFNPGDTVLNALPMFHSFGLGLGTLLPIFEGVMTYLYPSPLHVRMVPDMVYDTDATITFGTDSFLSRYAQHAHPYDFRTARTVFAGGEKLRDETRQAWMDKFGVRILEGYGATEAAPVVAMNTLMHNRKGTVGRIVPGLEVRIVPVKGVAGAEGAKTGRLFIKGDNIMLGYLKADAPGRLQPPSDPKLGEGWYDTGDIVSLDADGYLSIVGRVKRFAKVAGEMVSLSAAEEFLQAHWPEGMHAVVALSDPKKGERLVLVTTQRGLKREQVLKTGRAHGRAEITLPREVVTVKTLPLLGTGKPNYPEIAKVAQAAAK